MYAVLPLAFSFITAGLFLSGARPLLAMARANLNMILVKGAPSYTNEYNGEFKSLFAYKEVFDENEIQIPEYGTHYGNLLCERAGLEAPVYYGDSEDILEKGAGQYAAGALPGEGRPILIGGHDTTYFASLKELKIKDKIVFETNYGTFFYEVKAMNVLKASDTSAYTLDLPREQLILYTCYPFGKLLGKRSERYFVYCDRIIEKNKD